MITVTKKGIFRKTRLSEFENIMKLQEGNKLRRRWMEFIDRQLLIETQIVFLITKMESLFLSSYCEEF